MFSYHQENWQTGRFIPDSHQNLTYLIMPWPQLDKCLTFMAFWGVILYRIQLFLQLFLSTHSDLSHFASV